MNEGKKIPDGYHSITPMLIVKDGLKAIEYYKKVFGAIDKGTMMMPDNKSVAHAELLIGDSKIMLSDEFPEMKVYRLQPLVEVQYRCIYTLKMWTKHLILR